MSAGIFQRTFAQMQMSFVILQELENQIAHTGNQVWITWVGERMNLLQEKGLEIPIMKDVDALRLEYYEKLEKRLS